MKKLYLLSSVLALLFCSISPTSIHAQSSPVSGKLSLEYRFVENGDSTVFAKVDITNNTSTSYAPDFELQLTGDAPQDVKAFDEVGELPTEIVPHEKSIGVKLKFLRPVGGKGRTQSATLQYSGPKAILKDKVWEIAVPAVNPPDFLDETQVTIVTPPGFGIPIQTTPSADRADTLSTGEKQIHFGNQTVQQGKITVHYAHFQTYKFNLKYDLSNSSSTSTTKTISLPSDSFDHLIEYDQIDPKPINVLVTNEGWNALYELKKNQQLQISVTGIISSEQEPSAYLNTFTSQVKIESAPYKYDSSIQPEILWHHPWQYLPFKQNVFNLEISNPNGAALYHVPVLVAANGFELTSSEKRNIDTLPPFGKIMVPLLFKPRFFPPEEPRSIVVGVGTTSITYNISDNYVIIWYISYVIIITGLVIGLGFLAFKTRHLHIQKLR